MFHYLVLHNIHYYTLLTGLHNVQDRISSILRNLLEISFPNFGACEFNLFKTGSPHIIWELVVPIPYLLNIHHPNKAKY